MPSKSLGRVEEQQTTSIQDDFSKFITTPIESTEHLILRLCADDITQNKYDRKMMDSKPGYVVLPISLL
jgi:uncharacterized membrane protein YkvA (DUF1232 family)